MSDAKARIETFNPEHEYSLGKSSSFVSSRFVSQLRVFAILGSLVTIASCLGASHWVADLLAQLRFQWLICWIVVVIGFAFTRRWRWMLLGCVGMVVCGYQFLPYYFPPDLAASNVAGKVDSLEDKNTFRLMSLNVLTSNRRVQDVIDLIEAEDPDFLVLLEVNQAWEEALGVLDDRFSHSKFQSREDNFGIAFLSKHQWADLEVFQVNPDGVESMDVRFSELGDLRIVATHPLPPIGEQNFNRRNEQLFNIAARLNSVDGQATQANIVVGDFNLTPWSPLFEKIQTIGGLRDTALGLSSKPTWHVFPTWLGGLKIDHALAGAAITVQQHRIGPDVGSDHRAVVLDFSIEGF